jgi:hypothetical protein
MPSLAPPAPRRAAALVAGVAAVLILSACGAPDERRRGSYDPRLPVVSCLRDEGLSARRVDRNAILTERVRIEFLRTPGEAEARQIAGRAQGAEQIGRALIFVGAARDGLLARIEECVDR